MAKKKEEKIDLNNIPEEEKVKYEIDFQIRFQTVDGKVCQQKKPGVQADL